MRPLYFGPEVTIIDRPIHQQLARLGTTAELLLTSSARAVNLIEGQFLPGYAFGGKLENASVRVEGVGAGSGSAASA